MTPAAPQLDLDQAAGAGDAAALVAVVLFGLLNKMLYDASGAPDHMTACERTMGATHPCTCGADQARALLERSRAIATEDRHA
jgi:hypothetical protein